MNKKVIKLSLIIVLAIIILFVIHVSRNFIIVKNLQNRMRNYASSTNYHIKSIAKESEDLIITMNYYKKDKKQLMIMERNDGKEISKISMYDNGNEIKTFYDNENERIVELDDSQMIEVNLYNFLETENDWQTILGSIMAKIEKTEYNGKDCYIINNFTSPMFLSGVDKNEVYIEKDTGLFVKSIIDSLITQREYEFENVKDEIFIEPDINEYKVQ